MPYFCIIKAAKNTRRRRAVSPTTVQQCNFKQQQNDFKIPAVRLEEKEHLSTLTRDPVTPPGRHKTVNFSTCCCYCCCCCCCHCYCCFYCSCNTCCFYSGCCCYCCRYCCITKLIDGRWHIGIYLRKYALYVFYTAFTW